MVYIKKLRVFFERFIKKDGSLLSIIKSEIKTSKQLAFFRTGPPIWMPSVGSTAKIFALMLPLWLASNAGYLINSYVKPLHRFLLEISYYGDVFAPILRNIYKFLSFDIPDFPPGIDLVAIHTGIGAVLVGLAFFVAGSLSDKDEPEKGRVLLYRSYFFPLLTSEVFAFFFFFREPNIIAIVPLLGIAFGTVLSLGRVIDVLVHSHKLEEAKKELLISVTKKAFVQILDREIQKRIWSNNLYKHYEKSEVLQFSPFGFWGRDDVVKIEAPKTGVIKLRFKELEKLNAELSRAVQTVNTSSDFQTTTKSNIETRKIPFSFICKSMHDKVDAGDSLIEIDKIVVERIDLKKIRRIALNLFKIERDMIEPEARTEIAQLKDRCLSAIEHNRTGELEKIIRLYTELVGEFFEYFTEYGGGFSSEQAEKERGSLTQKLKPLDWLSKDIWEIFRKGIESEDVNVIRDVAFLPILLAQKAIEKRDHLIFQEFIHFPSALYERAFELDKEGKARISKIMFDRTWRYLKELVDFHLEPKLRHEDYPIDDFKHYAVHVLKVFQNLLKSSFDKSDLPNFEKFLETANELFDQAERLHLDEEDPKSAAYEYIDTKRQEMFFGIAAWILFTMKSSTTTSEALPFLNAVQGKLPNKLEDLTGVFLRVHSFESEDFWGWSWWESAPEGRVHAIRILEKLEQFFVVRALSLLRSKTDDELSKIKLPHNRDLAFLAEGTRDVMGIISDIENHNDNWRFILDPQSMTKCSALRELLQEAHENQEKEDIERKRLTRISESVVQKFKENLITDYKGSNLLKTILDGNGCVVDRSYKPYHGASKKFGVNTLFDKAAFFGDDVSWHVHFMGIDDAFGFGQTMSKGENEKVLEEIEKKSTFLTGEKFMEAFLKIKPSNAIILATNHAVWNFFERNSSWYLPKWHKDFPHNTDSKAEGVLRYKKYFVPVYQILTSTAEVSKIYILDKTKIGKYIQLSPLDKDESMDLQKDIFLMDIQEFLEGSAALNKMLAKPPAWLSEIGNKEKQIKYLQERVLIHIFERFEFSLSENFVGFVIEASERHHAS